MRPIVITTTTKLASAPEEVWRFVSDTDRTNRVIGSKPVEYAPIEEDAPTSARFIATTTAGGFSLTYEEQPFEWTHARSLRVVRKMRGGLLDSYTLEWSLAPSGAGTDVTIRLELLPRYGVLKPAAWLQGRQIVAKLRELAESIDAFTKGAAPSPFELPGAPVDEDRLADATSALLRAGVGADLVRRIAAHVRSASDADLVRVRPFELADLLKEPRSDVLRAMLHAVPAGLFDLKWAIVCPSCNTASELAESLDEITPEGHCQLCDIRFELEIDRAVEATFIPHAAVRSVPNRMFCMGGPARTPHVWSQTNVEPGETRALEAPRDPGRYRVFARGGAAASVEVETGAPREARVTLDEAGLVPAAIRVAPGGSVAVTSGERAPVHVKIERLGYASDAATAHMLSMVDEFRRLFSRDLLKRGTPLKVTRVAILFSDLTGSTALYTRVGDAAAFRLVDDHFDVLRAAIRAHDGVLVKTMGDAVMAAFADPAACARAAADALAGFERFRASHEHGELVGLKVGMFAGPCYVVTANGSLDYFGQTVNVASRVQHLAESGEVVMPHDLFVASGSASILREGARFEARVKGVDDALDLVRAVATGTPLAGAAPELPGRAPEPKGAHGNGAGVGPRT